MRIIASVPIAPHSPLDIRSSRGVVPRIRREGTFKNQVERYRPPWADSMMLVHPFGRWPYVPVYGSAAAFTSMRVDAAKLAAQDPANEWLIRETIKYPDAILYTGANPTGECGYLLSVFRQWSLALDASALQFNGPVDAFLKDRRSMGRTDWREANRYHAGDNIPCIAKAKLWMRGGYGTHFYGLKTAPRGSIVWFQNGIRTKDDWEFVEETARAGLEVCVNLARTDTERLRKIRNQAASAA